MNTVEQHIANNPMGSTQKMVVALCVLLNMMDGVDILITAFTATALVAEWDLSNKQLGLVLGSGLFGMAAGALFLAPWADRIGRKATILLSLTIISSGLVASAFSQSYIQLCVMRFITGIGIGGMIASINTITAEFSSLNRRDFCVSLVQSGNPVGGVLGGIASVYLLSQFGWRVTFLTVGLVSFSLIPLIWWKLPESVSFLTKVQPRNALVRANRVLAQMGQTALAALPEKTAAASKKLPVGELFNRDNLGKTLLFWLAFFSVMYSFYFTMSWTPKLLVQAGLSVSEGISGSIVLNLGGLIGAPLLGFFAAKYGLQRLILIYALATCLLMIAFGNLTNLFTLALLVATFLGFFLFGSIVGLYALAPHVYGVELRSTGIGFAIGVGRIGAVLAPFLAGYLLDLELSIVVLFFIFALPMLVSGYAQYRIRLSVQ